MARSSETAQTPAFGCNCKTAKRVVLRYLTAVYVPKGPAKSWETRKENDDFAKMNIPEKYHLLWEKTKGQYKGDPETRSEQFMENIGWEGEDENIHLQNENADKMLKDHEKQVKKENLCRKRCPTCYTDDKGDGGEEQVPF